MCPQKRIFAFVVGLVFFFSAGNFEIVSAQKNSTDQAGEPSSLKPDEDNKSGEQSEAFQKWALFPVIASNAESGLMLGGMAFRFIEPSSSNSRTNTVDMIAFGTLKSQYQAVVSPNFYFSDGLYHLDLSAGGSLWPANYYGIGNDSSEDDKEEYEKTEFQTELLLERRLGSSFYAGAGYSGRYQLMDTEENGRLESNEIIGAEDGFQSGLGFTATFDNRDNPNDARNGSYLRLDFTCFNAAFASDYNFTAYNAYLRHYVSLSKTTALALGGQVNIARGDIPFTELNSPDGSAVLRGIENGRYRDRDMAALQTEYRFPIAGRWGGVLFAETAQVAHTIDKLTADGWKYCLGTGIRYALNPSERFNIRLDMSFVGDGLGFVLDIREAF